MEQININALDKQQLIRLFRAIHLHLENRLKVNSRPPIINLLRKEKIDLPADKYSRMLSGKGIGVKAQRNRISEILEKMKLYAQPSGEKDFLVLTTEQWTAQQNGYGKKVDFVYHYQASKSKSQFEIKKALLQIDLGTKEVRLTFYHFPEFKERFVYTGTVLSVADADQVCLSFDERYYIGQAPSKNTPSLCYLFCSLFDLNNYSEHEVIVGTFASTGPDCGLVALTRSHNSKLLEDLTHKNIIPDVTKILLGRSFSVGKYFNLFGREQDQRFVQEVKAFQGSYSGYWLENRAGKGLLQELKLEIYDGCKARFSVSDEEIRYGYLLDYKNGNLICAFDYNLRASQFEFTFVLRKNAGYGEVSFPLPKQHLIGIYSGVNEVNTPFAGRVLFILNSSEYLARSPKKYHLSGSVELDQLFAEKPYLKDFIIGHFDNFLDNIQLFKNSKYFDIWSEFQRLESKSVRRCAGCYRHIRVSSSENKIYLTPINITTKGMVSWKTSEYEEGYEELIGNATLMHNDVLSIFYHKKVEVYDREMNSRTWHQHQLIYLGDQRMVAKDIFEGLSTSFSRDSIVRSSRELYQFYAKDGMTCHIPVTTISSENLSDYPELQPIFEFLTQAPQNLILSKKGKNPDYRIEKNDFGTSLFSNALLAAIHGKTKEFVIALINFAREQGFKNEQLLDHHIEKGVLKGVISREDLDDEHI